MSELSARARIASEARPLPKMWIGFLLGIMFLAVELIATVGPLNSAWQPAGYAILTMSALIWFYWLYCVFKFHDAVSSIPGYAHPITPARAVGMHFVPFYNLYWVFKWPAVLAGFVNWRMQSKSMKGWIPGLAVLTSILIFEQFDGFVGAMLLFACGWYISRNLRLAFAAPPVPEAAMASPVSTRILDL